MLLENGNACRETRRSCHIFKAYAGYRMILCKSENLWFKSAYYREHSLLTLGGEGWGRDSICCNQ